MLDFFGFDAPIIHNDDTADTTDLYVYRDIFGSDDGGSEATSGSAAPFDPPETGTTGDDADPFDFTGDTEDVFVFVSAGSGSGASTADNATPAPEPPEYGWEYELKNIGTARHTATGAMLLDWLV